MLEEAGALLCGLLAGVVEAGALLCGLLAGVVEAGVLLCGLLAGVVEVSALLCGLLTGADEAGALLCGLLTGADEAGALLCGLLAGVVEAGALLCGLLTGADEAGALLCGLLAGVVEVGVLLCGSDKFSEETDDMYGLESWCSGLALQPAIRQQASIMANVFFIIIPFTGSQSPFLSAKATSRGRLYRCIVTNTASISADAAEVITNTGKAPKRVLNIIGRNDSTMIVS